MRTDGNLYEQTLKKKDIFEGRIINVHVDDIMLPNGKEAKREVVEHPGGVCVVVLNDKDEIALVRQYRYPYKEIVLEVPAGKIEKNEPDPFEAMKREQREETGTTGKNYVDLGILYPSPGYCNEKLYMWACREDKKTDMDLDEDEFLETEYIALEKAAGMVMSGEIKDAKTQTAILKTFMLFNEGKI